MTTPNFIKWAMDNNYMYEHCANNCGCVYIMINDKKYMVRVTENTTNIALDNIKKSLITIQNELIVINTQDDDSFYAFHNINILQKVKE